MQKGIKCPHCNYEHDNWPDYVETGDMVGEFPMDCEVCEKSFIVIFSTLVIFETQR